MSDFDDPSLARRYSDSTYGGGSAAGLVAPGKKTRTAQLPPRPVARAATSDASMAPEARDAGDAGDAGDAVARAAASSGAPLPADVRGRFESSLGVGLSG